MSDPTIAHQRLANLHIAHLRASQPVEVVRNVGAMQAQDYAGALWAIGLRADVPEATVVEAIANHQIVRTWPMRGTLHFVAAEDAHWMLALLTPRMIAGAAARRRNLELDDAIFAKATTLFVKALSGGKQLTRSALLHILEEKGISTANQRGYHILGHLAQKGVLCFGVHQGKQPTFALLDEWVAQPRQLSREEALVELATRYFTSHGPATQQDLMRWAGMTATDAKLGIAGASKLAAEKIDGQEYWRPLAMPKIPSAVHEAFLLPGFDEYMLGYKDRSFALEAAHSNKIVPGNNGMFLPTMVINGQVVGTWKRKRTTKTISIIPTPFTPLTADQQSKVRAAAITYGTFLGLPATVA